MRSVFEIRTQDSGGRLGELEVPRAETTIETPALLPVVNPKIDTIDPSEFASFGVEMLITNSYIIHGDEDLHEQALEDGLHELLDFEGAIMTDSGSFQLAAYGDIDVTTEEILQFQHQIGSDIGTPVDIPTGPDASRETAQRELETTTERLETASGIDTGEMLLTAPVQGATELDLRTRAARDAYRSGLDVFPVGGVVPLLSAYRYDDVIDVVMAARRGLGMDAPVHLFGAGHPMVFALAVAAGCDLFDSAAYAIYARDDRYLTVRGTEHLEELDYLPCSCPICTEFSPDELRTLPDRTRESRLAEHNLHVSLAEIRRIKQAIRDGSLLELVESRARGHPAMLDGYRALLAHSAQLETADPASKGTFFYCSADSARRPEVIRHHERLERLALEGDVLLSESGVDISTFTGTGTFDAQWLVRPPFGPVPPELAETYPVSAEVPERMDDAGYEQAARGLARLAAANPDSRLTLAHSGWPASALEELSDLTAVAVGDGRE